MNLYRVLAVAVMAAALTVPGYAKPGHGNGSGHGNGGNGNHGQSGNHGGGNGNNGNHGGGNGGQNGNHGGGNGNGNAGGNGHGHGKPTDGNTSSTFLIGSVSTSDTRILDLTGDYVLSSTLVGDTSSSLVLSIVQDGRGRLVSSTTLTLADGTTTWTTLTGHLQLTAQTNLRFQLEGGLTSVDGGTTDSITTATGVNAHIVGYWNGTAFNTTAVIEMNGQTSTFGGSIVPVNPLRGFTISDTTQTLALHGPSRSVRTVTLPWGTETVTVQQKANKNFFMFMAHSANFGIDLRGSASSSGLNLSRAQIHLGYGSVRIDPADITATETGATTP